MRIEAQHDCKSHTFSTEGWHTFRSWEKKPLKSKINKMMTNVMNLNVIVHRRKDIRATANVLNSRPYPFLFLRLSSVFETESCVCVSAYCCCCVGYVRAQKISFSSTSHGERGSSRRSISSFSLLDSIPFSSSIFNSFSGVFVFFSSFLPFFVCS